MVIVQPDYPNITIAKLKNWAPEYRALIFFISSAAKCVKYIMHAATHEYMITLNAFSVTL